MISRCILKQTAVWTENVYKMSWTKIQLWRNRNLLHLTVICAKQSHSLDIVQISMFITLITRSIETGDLDILHLSLNATKMNGFLERNCQSFSNPAVIQLLSKSYVRLSLIKLEYASIMWDPYYTCHRTTIERVQRRVL